ncbi:TPA: LXG domain-containing protein [Listeria monocytogenes]|nr:LXG domain-containing protein [Listeria monocytogenes]HDU7567813.1 LXG domain-containing protein [Listeria monocytogenes]
MSRIDIGEIQAFLYQLRAANEPGRKTIQSIKAAVTKYVGDNSLKGKAVDASKNYYQMTYFPLCDAIIEAMDESEERLGQYIQDFHAEVDSSPDAKIDADGLYELGKMIDRIESKKEALAQRMNSGTEGQMQNYRSQLAIAYKQENILEKYLSFEQSHANFFDHLIDLVQAVQQTIRELQSNIQFNSQTGTYDLSKLNSATVSRMQQALNKSRGIKEDIIKELRDYTVLAVVYLDSNGKEQVMWLLERDGVGVENAELKAYLTENGKYLNPEDYTIITNEELNKKINQSWRDGVYYLNGNKYDGLTGGVLSTSAYVEAGKGYIDKSGFADVVLGLGLSTAVIRGSLVYKKVNGPYKQNIKNRYPNEVQQGKIFDYTLENGQVKIRDGIKEVDFIIDLQGNLKVGRGHAHLSNGGDVQAAGKLKVDSNGNVRRITNESGHYTPTLGQAKNYQQIFENTGINTKNAWLETYQLDVTKSGYVDLAKLKRIDSVKLK